MMIQMDGMIMSWHPKLVNLTTPGTIDY